MAQNNLAYYTVTGPVHVFTRAHGAGPGPNRSISQLGTRGSGNIFFVGHTENSPELAGEPQYKPVFCSLSGEAVPDDKLFLGTNFKLVLDLQRFDFDIIHALAHPPHHGNDLGGNAIPLGAESYLTRGRLAQAHGDSYELWLQYSFFDTVNQVGQDPSMPPGFYFPCCTTSGYYPTKLARDAKKVRLMIEPMPVRVGVTGGFFTYSKDPTYFQNLPDPG